MAGWSPHPVFVPLVLLASAQTFDVVSTILALGVGGVESNPVVRSVLAGAGWWGLVALKAGGVGLAAAAALADPVRTVYVQACLWLATAVSWLAVLWNVWGYAAVTGNVALAVAYSALGVVAAAAVMDRDDAPHAVAA